MAGALELNAPLARAVRVGKVTVGGGRPLVLIAGPCVVENEKSALSHAKRIQKIAARLHVPLIYKSSYDKANRSSSGSFRGLGMDKGLMILQHVKDETGLPILTDVHTAHEAACTGKVVNVKKGQFLAPWEMGNVAEKIAATGNKKILLTERGSSFGYNTLVSDFRSIPIMKRFGYPVVFDATHSVQQPGGLGKTSGGQREFVPVLAQAGVVAGADAVFMEVHEDPDRAPSDGPNMVPLRDLERLLARLVSLNRAVRNGH
jgi:2-dehydro-3-deoxyphosphooctonate aldolase (KDO 8-P synthase)